MAKLAPGRGSLARALIAGAFAWLLALQGFAAATSPHKNFPQRADGQAAFQSGEYCGARDGGGPSAPYHHDRCECCILCAWNHFAGGLAALAAIFFTIATFSLKGIKIAIARRFLDDSKPPASWTSSWSQRAPPLFS